MQKRTGSSSTNGRFTRRTKEPVVQSPSKTRKPKILPLWNHQKQTIKLLRKQPRVLDLSDPGTAKTRAHLEAFAERLKQNKLKGRRRALVVAPKSLLQPAWQEDINKFLPWLSSSIAYAENREAAFEADVDIYIINTDGVKWLATKTKRWLNKTFGEDATLIIDEITTFKHRTSGRSKAIRKLSQHFTFRSGLTGTPNSISVTELWHQALLIDDGKRLGTSFFKFRSATCEPVQIGPQATHIRWEDKEGAEDAVAMLLADISIRHEFEVVMKHVPKNYTRPVKYQLPRKLLTTYMKMQDEAYLLLKSGKVTAVNAAVLRNKLLQIASGAVYGEPDNPKSSYMLLDTGRYELVADLLQEVEFSIAFFNWTHQKIEIAKELDKRKATYKIIDGSVPVQQRNAIVKQFQAGMVSHILLHPRTGAHGLTLTNGTRSVWASPVYQPDFLKQGKHRIWRGTQKHVTENILIEAINTVEHQVYDTLNRRNTRMVNFLDIIEASI